LPENQRNGFNRWVSGFRGTGAVSLTTGSGVGSEVSAVMEVAGGAWTGGGEAERRGGGCGAAAGVAAASGGGAGMGTTAGPGRGAGVETTAVDCVGAGERAGANTWAGGDCSAGCLGLGAAGLAGAGGALAEGGAGRGAASGVMVMRRLKSRSCASLATSLVCGGGGVTVKYSL
jgi:hypothetical protein